MSRTQPTDSEWAEMLFRCAYCKAGPGEWCETVRGRNRRVGQSARYLHNARWQAVREVIRLSGWQGYLEQQRAQAGELRRQNVALRGGLVALRGELEQCVARYREFPDPRPVITRIGKILDSAKEQQ